MTWRPSIFMPRDACRILLRVHAVRIERLADITADGIRAEGFEGTRAEFAAGWDTINGTRGSWASNPWVWVIKFHLEAHGPRVALDVKHGATMDVEMRPGSGLTEPLHLRCGCVEAVVMPRRKG